MGDTPSLPNSKIEAEDRHANFYDARVNLAAPSQPSSWRSSGAETSYSCTKTVQPGSSTIVVSAPSQPSSSPPKVSRQSCSQSLPRVGKCGQRLSICSASMLLPYAAYRAIDGRVVASVAGSGHPCRLATGRALVLLDDRLHVPLYVHDHGPSAAAASRRRALPQGLRLGAAAWHVGRRGHSGSH